MALAGTSVRAGKSSGPWGNGFTDVFLYARYAKEAKLLPVKQHLMVT